MLQYDLDEWQREMNHIRREESIAMGKRLCRPFFLDFLSLAKEKMFQYSNDIPTQKKI